MDVKNALTRTAGKAKLGFIKYSPEITLAVGIISGGLALASAIKETLHAEEVLEKHEIMIDEIKGATELAETNENIDYTAEDAKKDTVKAYLKTGWAFAKLYAPTAAFTAVSVTCILTSHGIMRKRNIALASTLAAVRTAFDEYRGRVVKELGEKKDEHFLYDTVEEVKERIVTDPETGKDKKTKEKVDTPTKCSVYSRFFDEANVNHDKNDGNANYRFIKSQLIYLQGKLIADGYLLLNDVYRQLGLPISIAGQSAGWIFDYNDRDNTLINFKGFDVDEFDLSYAVRALKNGYETNVLIDFENIRDDILTDIPRVNSEVAIV